MADVFESSAVLFHTVFNRTVENFYKIFMNPRRSDEFMARELLRAPYGLLSIPRKYRARRSWYYSFLPDSISAHP
jgi:hypothetical protein